MDWSGAAEVSDTIARPARVPKVLKERGMIRPETTERILTSSIAHFEAFNHVRNNHSMAHDNSILGYDEASLIYSQVASSVRFNQAPWSALDPFLLTAWRAFDSLAELSQALRVCTRSLSLTGAHRGTAS